MDEQKKNNDIEEAASALIANAEEENSADNTEIAPKKAKVLEEENDKKIFKKIQDKRHRISCYNHGLHAYHGRGYAAARKRSAVRYRAVGTRTSIFDFSRNRDDESKKAGRASVSVDIHIGIPDIYVSADGSYRSMCAYSGNSYPSYFPRV